MTTPVLTSRKKAILAGLYLSKFDLHGLSLLGFGSFTEAFNVIGVSIGVPPASIKNYRDEFDPLFPNDRQGWHRRPTRKKCAEVNATFGGLTSTEFAALIKSVIYRHHDLETLAEETPTDGGDTGLSFANRLITGQAAECYFRDNFLSVDPFTACGIQDTTMAGCGFDFRLSPHDGSAYFGVEVKGLREVRGSVTLTDKEQRVARVLRDRYFLFIVKNFRDKPFHEVHQDPLGSLSFIRAEKTVVQVTWTSVL